MTYSWEALRAEFPVTRELCYLDHAAVAPLPLAATKRIGQYCDELLAHGAAFYPGKVGKTLVKARLLAAELLGTKPERIFMVRSTTQGLAIAATGIPVRAGDNVVLVDREFPANIRPWLPLEGRGVEVRFVPQRDGRVLVDDVARAVDAKTAAVSVSFVQFLSGFRVELSRLAEICRRHDALLVVDAIQGLGVLPLDVEKDGVDFLAADSHKWLLGPEGAGLGYVSPRAFERIAPSVEGWLAQADPYDMLNPRQPLKADAGRYEEGAHNLVGIHGMVGSLELLRSIGQSVIAERLLELTDYLVDALRRRGFTVLSPRDQPHEKSGIVLATRANLNTDGLRKRLLDRKIVLSVRGGGVRLSPHVYNTAEELDLAVAALE
ncbi:MAG: aminotransferase class V-fold PLP-dependent enzyme [Deltaproteobacteria bacterium]|nr:aminotransferase class V-fold PLP-dependent enzyme [Deltaproteobacteria bacterium]